MEIIRESIENEVFFKDILWGSCFKDEDDIIFMSIPLVIDSDDDKYDAVSLESGELHYFDNNDRVVPVKAELHIM